MDLIKIVKLVEYFDIAIRIILAVLFVIVVRNKKWRGNVLLSALCIAVFAALVLEVSVFNYPFYLRYFADPEISMVNNLQTNSNDVAADGVHVEMLNDGMRINNLNRKVASVFVDVVADNNRTMSVFLDLTDGAAGKRQCTKRIYNYMPYRNYIPFSTRPRVSELIITFHDEYDNERNKLSQISISDIVINKPIPFYFSGLRLLVISLSLFMIFSFFSKDLRASYWPI